MMQRRESPPPRLWSRWRAAGWGAAATLMLLPLLAMQLTPKVDWDGFDFAVLGTFLVGAGLAFELAAHRTGDVAYRAGVAVALAATFGLIWVNGAVGLIGSEDNPANLLFYGVLAVAGAGALVARLRAPGMARALMVTAFAQVLAALAAGSTTVGATTSLRDVAISTALFTPMWLMAAWLFRRAARELGGEGRASGPAA